METQETIDTVRGRSAARQVATGDYAEARKVLHLVKRVGPYSYGLGPTALNLTLEQHNLGWNAETWCLDGELEISFATSSTGLPAAAVRRYKYIGPQSVAYSPSLEQSICGSAGATASIVHQHSIWTGMSRATRLWRKAFHRPTVVSPHGTLEHVALRRSNWKKRLARLFWEGSNLAQASCLHATAPSEAESFRRFGLNSPIAIIPSGIPHSWLNLSGDETRFRAKFQIPSDTRIFLFLSQLMPKKGLPLLLEAANIIRKQLDGWLIAIAGKGQEEYEAYLRKRIQHLGLGKLVRVIGRITPEEKRDAYEAADVFVLPTLSDNFALVVTEALGASVPVIVTKGAPWHELVLHRAGWWPDINAESIAEALAQAAGKSTEDLAAMGRRGKALVEAKYTWRSSAANTVQLYSWLLGWRDRPEFVIQ